jgi:glycosyltransferase involved in cell wall biosynthesis
MEEMKMRFCVIGPTYPYRGGISHYNTLLCENLKRKHDVKSVSFKRFYPSFLYPGKDQKDLNSKMNLKTDSEYLIDSINPLTWIHAFLSIKKEHPDILIFHWWTPFFTPVYFTISFLSRYLTNTKILMICHNVMPHEKKKIDKILTKMVYRNVDFFIVHSEEDLRNLRTLMPNAEAKRTHHPTYEFFKTGNKNDLHLHSKEELNLNLNLKNKTILFFGFIREYKGLSYLIEAMPKVLEKQKVDLLIVGEFWDDKEKYTDQIKQLGIEKYVRIIDRYVPNEEVNLYFSIADVVVLPYISATQSGIIQIAFGFDKPVITTNVGGLPDVVKNGETGFIVPAGDANALSKAIVSYFEGNKEREFQVNVKIKKQKDIFSWNKMVETIESFCV